MADVKVDKGRLDRLLRVFSGEAEEETEKAAKRGASIAAELAPRDTGALANSIPASVRKLGPLEWGYGTTGRPTEYALIQEYEHRSKKGFYRRSSHHIQEEFPRMLATAIKRSAK